nr:sigma 54-interacting transcriptional regulator [uncultured Desulfuromonas sp.]
MDVSKDEFFREVTLRICSSLELKTALSRAFEHLRDYFPLDSLSLDIPDRNLSSIRQIALASGSEKRKEAIIPLPKELWNWLMELRDPLILSDPNQNERIRAFSPLIKLQGFSDLSLPLRIEDKLIGFLVLRVKGKNKYTKEHAELLASVVEPFAIALNNALAHEAEIKYREILLDDNRFFNRELLAHSDEEVIGASSGLANVMEMVRQVAPRSNTVLLMGETGTGKEVIANAIHFASSRKEGPFIKVNCGAIPESLIDSELFGHEKGAFTGATSEKRGRFERANGGTIFLDEIGELPPQAQVRLLRVLQNREIERVGGVKPIPVDIRVIAATHRDLVEMVSNNDFREDLWFRLNVFPIMVPPLRLRKEDIPALTRHFVAVKSHEVGLAIPPEIAPGALEQLINYRWPGNVRELENVVERELICHRSGQLSFNDLVPGERSSTPDAGVDRQANTPLNLDQAMARHISSVLNKTDGKIHGPGGAAELLGINPSTLRARMNKLGVKYGRRSHPEP